MKKSSSIIGLVWLLVIGVFNLSAFGSTPLPVGSEDRLREFVLPQVVRGYRNVDAPSMVRIDNRPTWVEVFGNGAEDVLDKLFETEIVFGLSNTNDKVSGGVWLYNKDGKTLFYGHTDYKVSDLKDGPPSYKIWMQNIPLLEGVLIAKLLALNPDGLTTRTEFLKVENGHLQFPPYLAGVENGIIVVRFEGNVEVSFNLWESEGQKPGAVTESAGWQIQSHYVVGGNDSAKLTVKFIETSSPPTVLLQDVRAGQTVIFDCLALTYVEGKGQYFERPTTVIITKSDGSMSTAPIFGDGQTSLPLEPGSYRLRFTWPTFQQNRTIWYGPDGEGKG